MNNIEFKLIYVGDTTCMITLLDCGTQMMVDVTLVLERNVCDKSSLDKEINSIQGT